MSPIVEEHLEMLVASDFAKSYQSVCVSEWIIPLLTVGLIELAGTAKTTFL